MSEPTRNLLQPAPSPTGAPVLPTWLAPYVAALVIIAGAALTELPSESLWAKACRVVVYIGVAYGVVSPGWRKGAALVLLCLSLTGCATLQQPQPVGEPSPLACYGAKRTREAWEDLIRVWVDEAMAAQEAYSCQPLPAPPPTPSSVP